LAATRLGRDAERRPCADLGGFSVLKGERVTLRPIREADLDTFWLLHTDIANRGPYYPRGVLSEPTFRKQFADTGFWTREEGTLLITTADGRIVGSVEFFPTVRYLSEVELSYQLFDRADDGHGYVSEAVGLLVRYLFENKALNRIRLHHPSRQRRLAAGGGEDRLPARGHHARRVPVGWPLSGRPAVVDRPRRRDRRRPDLARD
jgi:RimJ/RimL family protein N-acetyltransferase